MPIPIGKLPKKLAEQAREADAKQPRKKMSRKTAKSDMRYRCHVCREDFERYSKWEKHSKETGHGRGEAYLDALT